jgi:hypothetical protein
MTITAAHSARRTSGEYFISWLCLVLAGYALLGKGFAYTGVKPFYIGELSLVLGLIALISSKSSTHTFSSATAKLLLLILAWTVIRTVPFIGLYGIDAIRDGMIFGYGLFAFCVASALISQPDLFKSMLVRYRRFAWIFLALAWAIFLASQANLISLKFPGAPAPFGQGKGGDMLVHLAGATALVMCGMMKPSPVVISLIFVNFIAAAAFNRGGMVAFAIAVSVCAAMLPVKRVLAYAAWAFCVLALVLALINPTFSAGGRSISPDRLIVNVRSVFGESEERLDSTRKWRMSWWSDIVRYTFAGPWFLTGKGFGINLADDDGYQVAHDQSLRSPHNGHLTILARTGVPGFFLWIFVNLFWLRGMLSGYLQARKANNREWAGIFTFFIAYWAAFVTNTAFDVFIEGPMGGIWFWTLFGAGLAACHIHRYHPEAIRP